MLDTPELSGSVLGKSLAVGDEIEKFMIKVLLLHSLAQDDALDQFMSAMAVRCLNLLRATLLLSRSGLGQPASGCVRSLIEQRWVFEAVAATDTRDAALRRIYELGEYNRKKFCVHLRKLSSNERDVRITDEALSQIENSIDDDRKHFITDWSKLANRCSDLTAYMLLCDRTHPSGSAIESHILFNDSGQVVSITATPDTNSLPRDVLQACEIMIDIIAAGPDYWRTEEVIAQATRLRCRVHELWGLLPDSLLSTAR